jgi:uncharacterized damage-inducible protein DinB
VGAEGKGYVIARSSPRGIRTRKRRRREDSRHVGVDPVRQTERGALSPCRENWLSFIDGDGEAHTPWFDDDTRFDELPPRFTALEEKWTAFLADLDDARLAADFTFTDGAQSWSLPLHVQLVQLGGHAPYHRGQIALLVELLGGETVDTDYVDWWWATHREGES